MFRIFTAPHQDTPSNATATITAFKVNEGTISAIFSDPSTFNAHLLIGISAVSHTKTKTNSFSFSFNNGEISQDLSCSYNLLTFSLSFSNDDSPQACLSFDLDTSNKTPTSITFSKSLILSADLLEKLNDCVLALYLQRKKMNAATKPNPRDLLYGLFQSAITYNRLATMTNEYDANLAKHFPTFLELIISEINNETQRLALKTYVNSQDGNAQSSSVLRANQ